MAKLDFASRISSMRKIPAIKQFDEAACWAATLEWWAKAAGGGRPQLSQLDIMSRYVKLFDTSESSSYGTLTRQHLIMIWKDPVWKMDIEGYPRGLLKYDRLCQKLAFGPVIVGYTDQFRGGAHINVVIAPQSSPPRTFLVMEPDPGDFRTKNFGTFASAYVLLGWPRN